MTRDSNKDADHELNGLIDISNKLSDHFGRIDNLYTNIISYIKESAYVFVDSGYIYAISKYYSKIKRMTIDYSKLFDNICEELNLHRQQTLYFTPKPDGRLIKGPFISVIENFDRTTVFKKGYLVYPNLESDNATEKGVDVQLTLIMTKMAIQSNVKNFILIAGDADYIPLVDMVRLQGKKVILAYSIIDAENPKFSVTTNAAFFKRVDRSLEITEEFIKNNLLKKK